MNRRRLLLITTLCLTIGSNTSLAGERTEREMLSIAEAQLAKGVATRSAHDIEKLAEERHYAVYGNDTQGFVVVSRDDEFSPVLAYSDSHFDATHLPCGMQWWLSAVNAQMEAGLKPSAPYPAAEYVAVPHLCQTKWGQGDPYNFYTPELNGIHTPTGCVATAMSQIMKFFGYPAQGKGKGYYTLSTNTSSRVNENITSVYEWSKMQNEYKEADLTDEVRIPVAQLMKDAGLATNMNYGTNGSGAFSVLAARGFCYNFGYDSLALHCYYRDFFNDEMWMSAIYKELADGRPILYTGVSSNGGHAFVFDGVDEEGRIHVNWGWDGSCDGYFDFADLNPTGTNDHYNTEQSMVFGFKCQETPDDDEYYTSLWCTSGGSYQLSVEGKILMVDSPPVFNYHFLWFYGQFGAFFKNMDDDNSKDTFIKIGKDQNDIPTFNGTDGLTNSIFFSKVKPGKYQVYLASKALNERDYQPVRCVGGAPYYEVSISDDGTTSISDMKYFTENPTSVGIRSIYTEGPSSKYIYDLHGRQVGTAADGLRKGVYIIGGKKVVK